MKEAFTKIKFAPASISMIEKINHILNEYQEMGYRLSLRQLYYQLVARDIVPNNLRSYKNVGNLVSNGRQAGLIDWSMIEDRNRETISVGHWKSPAQIVEVAAEQFRIDKWEDQSHYITVMVEKDALSGVLEPVCRDLDISLTANKGYSSSSQMYDIGKTLRWQCLSRDKFLTVLYLGDHDPSGIDMTRDVTERLAMYSGLSVGDIEVLRLALNYDQVLNWQPPENPAKQTDSRFEAYVGQYGESSWELDAVDPETLANLVTQAVLERRDEDAWEYAVNKENAMRSALKSMSEEYTKNNRI